MKARILIISSAAFLLVVGAVALSLATFGKKEVYAAPADTAVAADQSSQPMQPAQAAIAITGSDLLAAGYTDVSAQPPKGVDYQPASYFWVDGAPDTANLTNLLMVSEYQSDSTYTDPLFNYGISRQPFTIPGGTGEEAVLSGDPRTALNFSKGDFYFVIIGPDSKKVEALALIIAGKIND
jgi:hypothetical protein